MSKYLVFLVIIFSSCSTVHKIFDKHKEKLDSTSVKHDSTIIQKHIDTTKTTEVKQTDENVVEIDLETPVDGNKVDTGVIISYPGTPIGDYFLQYNRKTGKITSRQPITKVLIKGTQIASYSNFTGGIDSSIIKTFTNDSTHEKKQETTVHQTVDKKGLTTIGKVLIWIGVILAFVIFIFILYIKKKKKTIQEGLDVVKKIL